MKKEIPLSLQVFHSSNEYKAHRLNRTEQLRLDDVRTVLSREQKLYAKEHALHMSRFNARRKTSARFSNHSSALNVRRHSTTSSSFVSPSSLSNTGRTSVLSAPENLQRNWSISSNPIVSSQMANQLCTSLSRLTTSSRFQRIQRQFSLASFTEDGLITKKGMAMTKNIPKARDILFKRKSQQPETESSAAAIHTISEVAEDSTDCRQIHTSASKDTDTYQQDCNRDFDGRGIMQTRATPNNSVSFGKGGKLIEVAVTSIQGETSLPLEVLKGAIDSNDCEQSDMSSFKSTINLPKTPKKRVTIKNEVDLDTRVDANETINRLWPLADVDDNGLCMTGTEEEVNDWSSFFLRRTTGAKDDPLQEKIKSFLTDQAAFNRAFPKRDEVNEEINDIQKELTSRAIARKEIECQEMKKKNEIVQEVLNHLGVKDPHIIANYDIGTTN